MHNKYLGILLFSKPLKENDLFVKFISSSDELISGIVYGGLSRKKRNLFQIGYYLNFDVSIKLNKPPVINAELSQPFIGSIINNKYKLNCLLSVTSLINLSIIEGQKIENIYKNLDSFLNKLFFNKKWLIDYHIFLFNLLKIIGYEVDYSHDIKMKYFNLENLQFEEYRSNNSIEFPFHLLDTNNTNNDINSEKKILEIFETVFLKYHLSNLNLQLPNQYHLFKKLITDKINE